VLSDFRSLPDAIVRLALSVNGVAVNLRDLIDLQRQNGPPDERLEELERTRAMWEAEMEALLLKANSTLKGAANAESRSRTMLKHAEKLTDPFAEEGDQGQDGIPPEYGGVRPAEGVHDVPVGVAPLNSKALAQRLKFLS